MLSKELTHNLRNASVLEEQHIWMWFAPRPYSNLQYTQYFSFPADFIISGAEMKSRCVWRLAVLLLFQWGEIQREPLTAVLGWRAIKKRLSIHVRKVAIKTNFCAFFLAVCSSKATDSLYFKLSLQSKCIISEHRPLK